MPPLLSAVLLATAPALRVWGGGGEGGMLKPPDVMLCLPGAGESRAPEQDQDCGRRQEAEVKLAGSVH